MTKASEGEAAATGDVYFEEVVERCCGTGRWQFGLVGLMSLIWLLFPGLSVSMMFVGATPEFRCADGFDGNATFASLPADTPRCHALNSTAACARWVFDRSVYQSTVVTEWNLVCDRKPLLSMLQSWLMLGAIVGSALGGQLADRFGRRPVFLPFMVLEILCAGAAALAPNYSSFAVVRFLCGVSMGGMICSQYVMVMELGGSRYRGAFGTVSVLPFAFGSALVALFSYAIRTRWLLQLAYAAPFLILLVNFWAMPESPRWLVFQGRFEEAYDVLLAGARCNRRTMPPKEGVLRLMAEVRDGFRAREAALRVESGNGRLERILQLVRTPRMRRYTVASAFIGFVIAGVYFGTSFNTTQLSENPHLAAALTGLVEIPAYLIFPMLDRFGRRSSQALYLFTAAVASFLVLVKKDATFWLVLGLVAKLGVSCAISEVFMYVPEYTPTQLRGLGFGVFQTALRLGPAASPFVVDLVSELHERAPSAVFGAFMLLAGLATFLLPETLGKPMPETVADVESAGKVDVASDTRLNSSSESGAEAGIGLVTTTTAL